MKVNLMHHHKTHRSQKELVGHSDTVKVPDSDIMKHVIDLGNARCICKKCFPSAAKLQSHVIHTGRLVRTCT